MGNVRDLVTEISERRQRRFLVYRTNILFEPFEQEAAYDTVEQVLAHKWRLDRHYKIRVEGKYMTRTEFREWAKGQK